MTSELETSTCDARRAATQRHATSSNVSLAGFGALMCATACVDLLGDIAVDDVAESVQSAEPSPFDAGIRDPAPGSSGSVPHAPSSDTEQELELAPDAGASPSETPALAATFCDSGAFRCDGAVLELCLEGERWVAWQTCASPMLCQSEPAGRCLPAACTADRFRCNERALERCDADRTGWTEVATCATSGHCDALGGRCLEAPCAPDERRCNGGVVEVCRADRLGWDVVQVCATEALCRDAGLGAASCLPPACEPDEYDCTESGVLTLCNPERTGLLSLAQCTTPALCDPVLGQCAPPACSAGQRACTTAGELLRCNDLQTALVPYEPPIVCGDGERCDAARGSCERLPAPAGRDDDRDDDDDDDDRDDDDRGDDDRGNRRDDENRGRGRGRRGDRD